MINPNWNRFIEYEQIEKELYEKWNERQRKAYMNIYYACEHMIGELENTLSDYCEDEDIYKDAKDTLSNHSVLLEDLYVISINEVHMDGHTSFGHLAQSYLKDIRFCGEQWLKEQCDNCLRNIGY